MKTHEEIPIAEKVRMAEQSLARQLDWIRAVESKVSVIIAINVAMLGFVVTSVPNNSTDWKLLILSTAIGAGPLLASLVFCTLASFPRIKSPNLSLLFFGSISSHSNEEYTKRFDSLTAQAYLTDLLTQIHRNAEIAAAKFRNIKWASGLLLAGIMPWIIALYLFRGL